MWPNHPRHGLRTYFISRSLILLSETLRALIISLMCPLRAHKGESYLGITFFRNDGANITWDISETISVPDLAEIEGISSAVGFSGAKPWDGQDPVSWVQVPPGSGHWQMPVRGHFVQECLSKGCLHWPLGRQASAYKMHSLSCVCLFLPAIGELIFSYSTALSSGKSSPTMERVRSLVP